MRRAPNRAITAPEGMPRIAIGASSAARTTPILVGEPVVERTNQGSARNVICEPRDEITSAEMSARTAAGGVDAREESDQPHAVLLHDLAVELDPGARHPEVLTMSQWMRDSFLPPRSGIPLPSARWTVPSIFSSKSVLRM